MWRALFFALGIYAMILGGECLVIDRVELSANAAPAAASVGMESTNNRLFQNSVYQYQGPAPVARRRVFKPREWMPWSLIAAGIITVIYTGSYAKRGKPGE